MPRYVGSTPSEGHDWDWRGKILVANPPHSLLSRTMIETYAVMRGAVKERGPLYKSLPTLDDQFSDHPSDLYVSDRRSEGSSLRSDESCRARYSSQFMNDVNNHAHLSKVKHSRDFHMTAGPQQPDLRPSQLQALPASPPESSKISPKKFKTPQKKPCETGLCQRHGLEAVYNADMYASPKPNHYRGDQGFANYGYLSINGRWVDPDSEGSIVTANQDPSRVTTPVIPGVDFKSGPRILFGLELDKEYTKFMAEVDNKSDDSSIRDSEGDPREGRVSPATFLKWCIGAVKGDHYEFRTVEEQGEGKEGNQDVSRLLKARASPTELSMGACSTPVITSRSSANAASTQPPTDDHGVSKSIPSNRDKQIASTDQHSWQAMKQTPRRRSAELPKLTVTIPQYDRDTGEPMSPAYSLDEAPVPMLSPAGINMRACPNQFSYSYPHANRQHNRDEVYDAGLEAYSDAPDEDEDFTPQGILAALEAYNGPSAPHALASMKAAIQSLINSRDTSTEHANRAAAFSHELSTQVDALEMEVALLRSRVKYVEKEEARRKKEEHEMKKHRRHAEMVDEYMEHLVHERGKADVATKAFEEACEKLRERAGGLIVERDKLRGRLGKLECKIDVGVDVGGGVNSGDAKEGEEILGTHHAGSG